MSFSLAAPYDARSRLDVAIRERGYAVLSPTDVVSWIGVSAGDFDAFLPFWQDLPEDPYLRDGGHYRSRRHASLVVDADSVRLVPHRAHWQSEQYNALHGGLERWFPQIDSKLLALPAFVELARSLAALADCLRSPQPWFTEAHQFRIDTNGGIGRPTPEGAHRDGVDFVAILLVRRAGIKGGETRLFEARGAQGLRFTMADPWSLLLLDDARVVHETTPVQPTTAAVGFRETLVLTLRARGFMAPGA